MKILNLTESADWDIVAYQVLHLSIHFARKGHNVLVLCPENTRLFAECSKSKVNVKPLSLFNKLGLLKSKFDIVNIYCPREIESFLIRRMAQRNRVLITEVKMGNSHLPKFKNLEPVITCFMASCPSIKENLTQNQIDPHKIYVVPPCINMTRWESAMLVRPAMLAKRPYKIGTITMDKTLHEQEFFLKVAQKVINRIPNTDFLIIGIHDDSIRALARDLKISTKIQILGERTDIPEIMVMLHVFVKTSTTAGLSMSLIEAMASAVACVVPKIKGLSDFTMHEKNGVLVEPQNVDSTAAGIIYLLENPALMQTIARMGYEYVNSNMSLAVVSNFLMNIYEDILISK
jgi:glycosyltransferase involved in cell wall biosynthesis